MSANKKNDLSRASNLIVLLLGIVFILVSIIVDDHIVSREGIDIFLKTIVSVSSKGISAVGIALVVGFVTAKIYKDDEKRKNELEKNCLQRLMQDTIISQEFIEELTQESKSKIIRRCLSNNNYSPQMSKYVLHKINNLQDINNRTVRSNIDYTTTLFKRNNNVVLRTVMSYRMYSQNGEYAPIQHDFEKDTGKILDMKILSPNGDTYDVPKNLLQTKEEQRHYNDKIYTNTVIIPPEYQGKEYLTFKITAEEIGYEHWAHLVWMSLYPTEIISYKIICQDNLIIKEHMIFDNQKNLYYVRGEKNKDGHIVEYTISCDKWTDPYTGFALVIAEP